jgi:hypothetical protein
MKAILKAKLSYNTEWIEEKMLSFLTGFQGMQDHEMRPHQYSILRCYKEACRRVNTRMWMIGFSEEDPRLHESPWRRKREVPISRVKIIITKQDKRLDDTLAVIELTIFPLKSSATPSLDMIRPHSTSTIELNRVQLLRSEIQFGMNWKIKKSTLA